MTSSVTGTTAKPRHHVAMCPFPFASHVASMLLLTRKIASSTTHVQISFFTTESSMKAFSPEDKSDNVFLRKVDDGLGGAEAVNPVEEIRRFSETVGESLRKAIEAAEEEVGVKITCLVADALMTFACSEIAEEKAVKWVALWTPPATALVAHMHTDQLRKAVGPEDLRRSGYAALGSAAEVGEGTIDDRSGVDLFPSVAKHVTPIRRSRRKHAPTLTVTSPWHMYKA